ncbi:hypothetical protein GCM10027280_07980 [Micromonospora polyrhachis]|uniref:Uncharacterized protein n=1 Tax=Micromonospora polyrhachis TaxID=1282883 RepID=A0A7W7SPC8_9ACTN|nr:hypothetical protein [Micromonospora polyrhachis]MBB4958341.1 hypothetical protein [Micromonospora polyrhachis]
MRTRWWAALLIALVVGVWGVGGYLATTPTDRHDYRKTAVQAAQSAYGAVTTARLTAEGRADARLYRRYAGTMLDDARDALAGAAKQFSATTPPDDVTTGIRAQLAPLLVDADTALGAVERAVDDEDDAALRAAVTALEPVGTALADFIEAHK